MVNVYVDLGAHTGKTTLARCEGHEDDRIWALEPNPACLEHPRWAEIARRWKQVEVLPVAAWICDMAVPFYRTPTRLASESGTMMAGKLTGDVSYEAPIEVLAIDFPRWLAEHISLSDHLVLKMDIEGAEYEVLGRMLEGGSIALVDELLIEFHGTKFDGDGWAARHQAMMDRLLRIPRFAMTVYAH